MKKLARKIVAAILWSQVKRLTKKNNFKVIAIAGSIGKTSTKIAVANMLQVKHSVQFQQGNYNDLVSVPLIFFGQPMPGLFNPLAWLGVFISNEIKLRRKYGYEYVVVELGTDAPGQLAEFIPCLRAEVGILTAITAEHMENFKTVDAVADEELIIGRLSSRLMFNKDLCPANIMEKIDTSNLSYGIKQPADLNLKNIVFGPGARFDAFTGGNKIISAKTDLVSEAHLYSLAAAILIAHQNGFSPSEIAAGLEKFTPLSGRMQLLDGLNNSLILDDSYNASPAAVLSALDTLYRMNSPHKIAVLGNMNELGDFSPQAHTDIGSYCDPAQLDLVITIGKEANHYLATAAQSKGCRVMAFDDPYSLGEYLRGVIKPNSLILVKGSQNSVFAEEAIKSILANPKDVNKLVRQSSYWMKKKKQTFGRSM